MQITLLTKAFVTPTNLSYYVPPSFLDIFFWRPRCVLAKIVLLPPVFNVNNKNKSPPTNYWKSYLRRIAIVCPLWETS